MAMKKLKHNKVAGSDRIIAETVQAAKIEIDIRHCLCNRENIAYPIITEDWIKSNSDDLQKGSKCDNYRINPVFSCK